MHFHVENGTCCLFTVEAVHHGVRIDTFLQRQLRNYTPFRLQRMIRAGAVRINERPADLKRRVFTGERVSLRLLEPPDKLFEPERLPLFVLYEDDWLLAVHKPAGQIVHPVGRRQSGTLCNALQHHFDMQTRLRGLLRPGIVHRLDRLTSGVMIVAKEYLSHKWLSIQFQRSQIEKEYLAVVEGRLSKPQGEIDLPIGQLAGENSILMTTGVAARNAKPARTHFAVLAASPRRTLLRVRPLSGRIHQVRVHLAAVGHPVTGDAFYGPCGSIRLSRVAAQSPGGRRQTAAEEKQDGRQSETGGNFSRHFLHAERIVFRHPRRGETMSLRASLPADFRQLVQQEFGIAEPATEAPAEREPAGIRLSRED